AEMRKRVGARLAQWAVAGQGELLADIERLTGAVPSAELLDEARTLFARALETPGGLRILTIHAFCEAVLHRFPIEAGVPFDFAVIEEDRQVQRVQAARESVLAEGLAGGAHAEAVETLFGLMSDETIGQAIQAALAEGARVKPVLAEIAGAKARLRRFAGHEEGAAPDVIESRISASTSLTPDVARSIVSRLNGNPEGNSRCIDLLARLDPDNPTIEGLRAAFFTAKGEPRSRLMAKKEIEA